MEEISPHSRRLAHAVQKQIVIGLPKGKRPQDLGVKKGDKVTLIVTNHDEISDLSNGVAISNYDINFVLAPFQTKSVTFTADKPGMFWIYCTNFCHALHLEMRMRFIVEV